MALNKDLPNLTNLKITDRLNLPIIDPTKVPATRGSIALNQKGGLIVGTNTEWVSTLQCDHTTPINQVDIGTTGFVITQPGLYCVTEDITWNPAGTDNAITIDADNVILDLNDTVITQVQTNDHESTGINKV